MPAAFESDTPIVRNTNVLQEKSSKHVAAIVGSGDCDRGESASMLEGRWAPRVHLPFHLPLSVVSHGHASCSANATEASFSSGLTAVAKVHILIPRCYTACIG